MMKWFDPDFQRFLQGTASASGFTETRPGSINWIFFLKFYNHIHVIISIKFDDHPVM